MSGLDRRRHALRDDLAAETLRGRAEAPRYVRGEPARIAVPVAPCRRRPAPDAPLDTELLFGEPVTIYEAAGGWSWVQSAVDGYVGYVPSDALGGAAEATHTVSVPLALVFSGPSIKVPVRCRLPMGARLVAEETVSEGTERFVRTAEGFVLVQHVALIGDHAADWVAVAELFRGAPYLFGGKSWDGLDCSALIQLAMARAGREAPRDSDMQEAELGTQLAEDATLQRGDLIFWRGHVGIMLDGETLLHANGHHHRVASEPAVRTIARLEGLGLVVRARRRP